MIKRLKIALKKYAPFIFLISIGIAFISFGGKKFIDINEIAKAQDQLLAYVQAHPFLFSLFFFATYFSVTVSLLPGLILLDLVAGFVFPQPLSFILVIFSAWCAAAALFLASRHAFKNLFQAKGGKWIQKIHNGFEKYEDAYLVFLRVFPFFPYSVISVAIGFLRISFWKYAWTTLVGILPSAFIFTMAGRHLNKLLNGDFSQGELLTPKIFIVYGVFTVALIGPLVFKKKKKIKCDVNKSECSENKDCE